MSRKIAEYVNVRGTSREINEQVNFLIKQGWEPLGGISTNWYDSVQAMVRYELPKAPPTTKTRTPGGK